MAKKFSLNDPDDQAAVKTNLIVDEAENKFHKIGRASCRERV